MTIGILANVRKALVNEVIPGVVRWLAERGQRVLVETDVAQIVRCDLGCCEVVPRAELVAAVDMVFAFGGDGTILSAAREVGPREVPILGVNLGGLGFLAGVTLGELYPSLEDVLRGEYEILERMVIRVDVEGDTTSTFFCLNDVVIDRGASPRVVQIEAYVDGTYLNTYVADGIIVATPTGSTAYSLSAGGPIVVPTMKAIVITPLCSHTLSARTVVLPDSSVVRTVGYTQGECLSLSADGQLAYRLRPGQWVIVRKANYSVKWVWVRRKSFYELLRQKLYWGHDLRRT
ncbi:MAG: NAD(+)/NADH kinase [candidate division KSB1 bacterium]|nr:NAD(+)/NADH kinase [candidate division KSB1 bacterium]